MSELILPRFIVLCNSRLALPGIAALHQHKSLASVACLTRDVEFEVELIHFTTQAKIPLKIFEKHIWQTQLEEMLVEYKPDAVFVKTFGFKIPSQLFRIPKWGFINFHYALLPQYRGSFPLYEVLKRREPYGGISVHYLTDEFDKGPLIMQQYVQINEGETYGKHAQNLADESAKLTLQLMEMLCDKDVILPLINQDESLAAIIARPNTADLIINWNEMNAQQIVAMILATNPWSKGAIAYWNNIPVQILFARLGKKLDNLYSPGQIIELSQIRGMQVACTNNESIWIDVIYMKEGYLPAFKLLDYQIAANTIADKVL